MFGELASRSQFDPGNDGVVRALENLSLAMLDPGEKLEGGDPLDNKQIPAGYTYLGQFLDHDLTFEPISQLMGRNDPEALTDFRTPALDLDCLYAGGPTDNPYMYDLRGAFLLGQAADGTLDLPRAANGRAIIGDPRNDENLIVSQLHLLFLRYHNALLRELADRGGGRHAFDEARQIVRFHYQWIIVHDYLKRIVTRDVFTELVELSRPLKLFPIAGDSGHSRFKRVGDYSYPYMPVEFTAAAYRFGHSMVRARYTLNKATDPVFGGERLPVFGNDPSKDLQGFRMRPADREIDWRYFFDVESRPGSIPSPQLSRKIDPLVSRPLSALPRSITSAGPASLPFRNLLRGAALGLPSGQDVAQAIRNRGISAPIYSPNLTTVRDHRTVNGEYIGNRQASQFSSSFVVNLSRQFQNSTPLWYFILSEANDLESGARLGPTGSRIVGEVIVGLLRADRTSYLNVQGGWKPRKGTAGCTRDGMYEITDLLRYLGAGTQ